MKYLSLSLVLAAIPTVAAAGTEASDTDRIVVTGEGLSLPPGTPAYGSVIIDRDRLTNGASGRIESVLGDVAGFQQFRRSDSRSANPSAQGATLRALGGNASSRTLVLLDGVPMADPFFGYIPFSALVPDRLSVVRVTRGGGIGAFGAGAVAGTIELASATRDQLPTFGASAFYGSKDATELTASLTPDLGGGYVSLSGRWDRGDGFQTTPRNQRVAATSPAAYDGWSTNLRAVAPLSATSEIQFRGTIFHDERTLRFKGADSMSEGQDASIRFISRGAWQVDALAYIQARNFSNIVISASTFRKSLDQRNTPSTGIGGKIELRPPVGPDHVLRIGADTRFATGDMFEDGYNANIAANPVTSRRHAGGEQMTTGLFAEDDWTLGRLVLTGGVRADRWTISNGFYRATGTGAANNSFADRSDWQFSGRAGALYRISDAVALRGAAYSGFRLPTLNELYRPFVVFPITTRANAALTPEKLKGVEAGIDLTPIPGLTLSATGFINRLDDAIANVTLTNVANTRERQNVDRITAKGIELTAVGRVDDFLLSASYAYSHSTVHAPGMGFDGLTPAQSPRHAASATLAWEPEQGPALSATLRYVGKQYEDDLQTDVLPDALTVDAVARLPLGHGVTLVARGENLFDEEVITRNAGGSIDLGTPRTLWIGFRFAS
ncbi:MULTISPECIES: TonB-dependent receptor [Sphingobium]|uniref:TonB-dependent receptor n=1 Tax=Sphingobium fuliginis (strain ATCC 27551) TaxID=336203 RepID=A0ABQ1EKV2_SPHSA|nr:MULTISPECIES: TonB-dependent receptor [Sphingobium]AJR22915.1 TonB-dependent receptor [Sphingobium sp. YBL2]RYM01288.1 TonB-dependent receptor [Sphingobium fuliginis]UXC89977.1 TonB-dependent receptor [Sphingobium sp. RSMS]WDA38904.1 TonB-dependent receptor [Sphingobium sp. YC-XJ3]GFZ76519.1 TonB-dependent receptor [Sphingobium fuliginis]